MSKKTNLVVGAVATVAATSLLVGCNLYGKEKYTVTYMTNGGNAIAPSEYTWGDEIVLPSNPTKVGHTFKGWFFDANLTNPVTDKYVIEGDVVVYAKWEVNQYTVSFDSNGGTEIADFKANYGTSIKVNDPVRKGYEFLGWYIDEELESEFDLKVPGSNSTVYAKWKACKIEITFNMNASGVTGEMGKATYQTEDEKLTLDKSNYAREGYDFKGWSTTPDGAVEFEDGGDVTPLLEVSQTVTLYAVWEAKTHDLHFIHDGLAYGDDIKVAYNSSLVLPSTNPVKDGHVFLGWGTYGLTNDATFADNKVYYTYNSASRIYSVASITVGATIPEETYYEAKLVSSTDVMPNSNLSLYSVWSINNYTINFDSKGGTAVDPITQAYGGAITLPTNITKVGYTFKGWYKDETYQTVFNSQTMPLNGATLYAKWEVNSYSIYFGSNLGSGTMAKMELTYEEEKTLSSNAFVRTGYTFVGWNTKEDGTGTSYTDGQKISKLLSEDEDSLTLYAQWRINEYSISFDSGVSSITQDYGTAVTLPTPSKTGYTFVGWLRNGTTYSVETMPAENVELVASWKANKYSIYFNSNSGTGSMSKIDAVYDTKVELTSNAFTKVGYTFAGWNTKEDGTGTSYTNGQEVENLLSEEGSSITLYAQWEANTNTQYVVNHYTINLDGSISTNPYKVDTLEGTSDATVDVELLTIEGFVTPEAQTVTINADGTTVLNVYYERQVYEVTFQAENPETEEVTTSSINVKFEGAITFSADYNVKNYSLVWKCNGEVVNSTTKVTSDMTLVAEYTRIEKTIVIHSEGQENVNLSDVQAGAKVYELLEEPTKEGYTFEGWYLDNNFTTELPSDYEMPEDNVDIYVKWELKDVTISFDSAEGTTVSPITQKYDTAITLPTDVTREGYNFAGWYTKEGAAFILTTMPASNVELVAHWTPITYSVVFDANGGNGQTTGLSNIKYDEAKRLTKENFDKKGYTFLGWSTTSTGEIEFANEEEIINLTTTDKDTITLYAVWEINSYTITFDTDGGSAVTSTTQNYGTNIYAPTTVKAGHTFLGWFTKDGVKYYVDDKVTMPEGGVELVAHWKINTYTVVFNANGGQGQTSSVEVNYGESRYLTENGFDRKGYKFLGWSTNKFAIDPEYENEAEIINLSLEDGAEVTLYAIWQIRQYEYKFVIVDDNGNQKEVLSSEVYNYDEAVVEPDPSKLEAYPVLYKFEGWHTDNKCTNDAIVDEKAYIEGEEVNDQILSITYYGKYTIGTYKVQFRYGNDGIIWETDSTGDTKDDLELVQTKFYGYVNSLGTRAKLFAEIYEALGMVGDKENQDPSKLMPILTYLTCFATNQDIPVAEGVNIPFNQLPPENQVGVLVAKGASEEYAAKVVSLLYRTFDLTNAEDATYVTTLLTTGDILQKYMAGLAKFDEVLGALEAAIGPTSSYMSYYSAEYNKYKSNAFCPVREGYTFNGWNIIIDDETGIKIVDATWVKKLEVPVYLRVQSIGKNSVTYAWNAVEGAKDYTVYFVVKDAKGKVVDLTNEDKGVIAVKDGENVIGNIVTTAYLGYEIGGLKDDYTVSVQVKANNPAGSTSNRIELPNGVTSDEEVVKVIESKEIDSDYTDEVSYKHEELDAVEISSYGDNYYQDKNNHVFYFFESTEYEFKNVTNIDVVVGSEYAKYENGALKINSNAVGHYIEIDIETSEGITEYRAYIQPKIASIGLGSNLTSYMDVKEGKSQSKFLKTDKDQVDYLIGAASTSSTYNHNGYSYDYVAGLEEVTYYNGFKFDIAVNSTSGNVYTSSDFTKEQFQLAYTFFDSEDKEIEDTSSLFIKDGDVFYFLPTSGEYKVEVTYKVDGWYVTEDKEPVSGKIYRDGPSEDANDITPPPGGKFDSSRTYYEYYQSVGIPDKVKKEGLSKFKAELTFKLDNSVNVYDNATLKSAFADPNVPAISIHGNIKSNLSTSQVVHVDYLKSLLEQDKLSDDVYWSTDVPHISIKEGTAVFSSESSSMKLYKRGTGANSIKAKEGDSYVSYVYCGEGGTHALVDAEWYNDYSGKAQFIVVNEDGGWNDGLYKQFGLDTAPIYQRESNNVSGGVKVNGNYFTLDASNIPYVVSKINRGQVDTTYHIQNSRIYLFLVASGNGTFNNLRIEGNTQNVTSNLGGATGTSLTIYQYMERTSGGLSGIKIERNEAEATTPTLYANNVVCEDVLIGVQGGHNTNISVDTTYINNTWSNSLYSYGGKEITIKDSKFTNSGGASMHITDLDIYDNNPTNDGNYVNPEVKLEGINFIENFISGEEPWFKQNNMEIAALNMKSKIESQVNMLTGGKYTVLKEDTDPVTGLKSEKMNLVMLGMPEHDAADGKDKVAPEDAYVNFIKTQGFFENPNLSGTYLDASGNMYLMFVNEDLGFAIQGMIQIYPVA